MWKSRDKDFGENRNLCYLRRWRAEEAERCKHRESSKLKWTSDSSSSIYQRKKPRLFVCCNPMFSALTCECFLFFCVHSRRMMNCYDSSGWKLLLDRYWMTLSMMIKKKNIWPGARHSAWFVSCTKQVKCLYANQCFSILKRAYYGKLKLYLRLQYSNFDPTCSCLLIKCETKQPK